MTPAAYRAARDRLGMGNGQICRLMGVDRRTGQRWEAGERDVAPPAERLLWLMECVPGVIGALRDYTGDSSAAVVGPTYDVEACKDCAVQAGEERASVPLPQPSTAPLQPATAKAWAG